MEKFKKNMVSKLLFLALCLGASFIDPTFWERPTALFEISSMFIVILFGEILWDRLNKKK